jgi:NDP-sugar pyrophosphorylase family protein
VVVNLHHRPATITGVVGHGDDLGVAVTYSWETTVLGSAGGPRRALDLLDRDRFLIVNGDTLTDLDLTALTRAHAASGALVTMAGVAARAGYNALRVVKGTFAGVIPAGAIAGAGAAAAHFIGVQVAERRAFERLAPDAAADSVRGLYPELAAGDAGTVRVHVTGATFHDVGTPAEYLRTVQHVAAVEKRPLDRGAGTRIAPSARVEGTVCWDDVDIGGRAELVDCVVADGARVPPGLQVRESCLLPAGGAVEATDGRIVGDLIVVPFADPGHQRG